MNYIRSTGAVTLSLALTALATCKEENRAPSIEGDRDRIPVGGSGGSRSEDEPDASAGEPDASVDAGDSGGAGGMAGTDVNCGNVVCRGAGRCVIDGKGVASCVCDKGYTLLDSGECIVDETCIELRSIEDGCRQRLLGEPAVAMAFYVETCAGTNVLPQVLGEVAQAFKVLEDGNDLGEESYAAVFDRGVESWVTIAIDMSTSVANDGMLVGNVIESVRQMVDSLNPAPGEPPVFVRLLPFGRSINVLETFTTTLSDVKIKLDNFAASPTTVVAEPDGTNLNGVINRALEDMELAIAGRVAETGGAVVSTATLVTITDGRDTGGVSLRAIPPRFNVISIGISGNINDQELTRVGPQGSFLAPDPASREAAFQAVAQRVKDYPNRAYLLAYCSPAVASNHNVQVTLANREAQRVATCAFDASDFGQGSACNEAFMQSYCEEESHGCGTFLACDPACWRAPADAGPVSDLWQYAD